ncbi:MAG: YicC family protein [Acidiferrobacteraceae bacterium]|nr:YicC family protein [Acidiferrobacteraceae bacterium]
MAQSMTAFSREESDGLAGKLTWEIRSVNHRYKEISLRLPDELRAIEPSARGIISETIRRGRIDATLHYQSNSDSDDDERQLNTDSIQRLAQWEGQLRNYITDVVPLSAADILRWPGVLYVEAKDVDSLSERASVLLGKALEVLIHNRQREGEKLTEILSDNLLSTRSLVIDIGQQWPAVETATRNRLNSRIAEFKDQLDPDRLEQEVVLLLSKADIKEELDRLVLHIEEVGRVLASIEPIGRRLDFLMQELHREANTLGSKSTHPTITSASIDLKVLIEQMREQVQNIE